MTNPNFPPSNNGDIAEGSGERLDQATAQERGEKTIDAERAARIKALKEKVEELRANQEYCEQRIVEARAYEKTKAEELEDLRSASQPAPAETAKDTPTTGPKTDTPPEVPETPEDIPKPNNAETNPGTPELSKPTIIEIIRENAKKHKGFRGFMQYATAAIFAIMVVSGVSAKASAPSPEDPGTPTYVEVTDEQQTADSGETTSDSGDTVADPGTPTYVEVTDEQQTADSGETTGAFGNFIADPATPTYVEVTDEQESSAEVATPKVEFISDGAIHTKNGDVEKFIYKGGYRAENDPRSELFNHQDEAGYENEGAYGLAINGDKAGMTTAWLKRVVASPEAIVRLRVQMGLESLGSLEDENARADALRNMSPEEYDQIANDTTSYFYQQLDGGSIKSSYGWKLENYMSDQNPGDHSDSVVRGQLKGDDDSDTLLSFYDKNGKNFVSSKQGFDNTRRDANADDEKLSSEAWINMDEGGTWKWKVAMQAVTSVYSYVDTGTSNYGGTSSNQSKNTTAEKKNAGPRANQQGLGGTPATSNPNNSTPPPNSNTASDNANAFANGDY